MERKQIYFSSIGDNLVKTSDISSKQIKLKTKSEQIPKIPSNILNISFGSAIFVLNMC